MGSYGINNQCHENHTTTTFLVLKLLVSSARMCKKLLGFEPPTLIGFSEDLPQLGSFAWQISRQIERERVVVVVVAWLEEHGTGRGLKAKKHSHQTIIKATIKDAVSRCNDAKWWWYLMHKLGWKKVLLDC
jgi:hypothetical protein